MITTMPFGKYAGCAMNQVPAEYLLYLYDNDLKEGPVREYITRNLGAVRERAAREKRTLKITFGQYKGWAVGDVPADYLVYLLDAGKVKRGALYDYIVENECTLRESADRQAENRALMRAMAE